jgi:hypothetical protein
VNSTLNCHFRNPFFATKGRIERKEAGAKATWITNQSNTRGFLPKALLCILCAPSWPLELRAQYAIALGCIFTLTPGRGVHAASAFERFVATALPGGFANGEAA